MQMFSSQLAPRTHKKKVVSWFDLFYDLSYVIAVDAFGQAANADWDNYTFVFFLTIFMLYWSVWFGYTTFTSKYYGGGVFKKTLAVVQMFSLLVMSGTLNDFMMQRSIIFLYFYIIAKLSVIILYVWSMGTVKQTKNDSLAHIIGLILGIIPLLLISVFSTQSLIIALILISLACDSLLPLIITTLLKSRFHPNLRTMFERFGAFTTLIFAESLAPIVRVTQTHRINEDFLFHAIIFTFLSCLLWASYFMNASFTRLHKRFSSVNIWHLVHLPIWAGVLVYGIGMEQELESSLSGELFLKHRILLFFPIAAVFFGLTLLDIITITPNESPGLEFIKLITNVLIMISAFSMSANEQLNIIVVIFTISIFTSVKLLLDILIRQKII